MREVRETLHQLYALHYISLKTNHAINQDIKTPWKLFIPSNFIYSFFTFNSIYSINWKESFAKMEIISNFHRTDGERITESFKFYSLIDFLYEKLKDELQNDFIKELKISLSNIDCINELKNIVLDNYIDQVATDKFIINFTHIWNEDFSEGDFIDSLREIIYFVYRVRNNIFHGTKNTLHMMDEKQQTRLKIYTSILTSLNKQLFELAKSELRWQPNESIINRLLKGLNSMTSEEITWEKAFIWSGFRFEKKGNIYDFSNENERNIRYLYEILEFMGLKDLFIFPHFAPKENRLKKELWLRAVDNLHTNAEGGMYDDLKIMDSYMGGIIRTINEIGVKTILSCDGNGGSSHYITLANENQINTLDICLRTVSKGKFCFNNPRISFSEIFRREQIRERREARLPIRNAHNRLDKEFLLEIAELLYENREKLKRIVELIEN